MLDERTHAIIHLELHIKQQDLELENQVPPTPAAPVAPAEPDAESDVDEE
jgi:hypothetical protein